jgi:hypothetical protein
MDPEELDNIPDNEMNNLLTYKSNIFEYLARDSLTILGIQLITIPLFISITGLFINLYSINISSLSKSSNELLLNSENFSHMFVYQIFAWLFAAFAVTLSIQSYYFARKRVNNMPNVYLDIISEKYCENRAEEPEFTHKYSQMIYDIHSDLKTSLGRFISENSHKSSNKEILAQNFDDVLTYENKLRTSLSVSLIFTFISITLLVGSFVVWLPNTIVKIIKYMAIFVLFFYSLMYYVMSSSKSLWGCIERTIEILYYILVSSASYSIAILFKLLFIILAKPTYKVLRILYTYYQTITVVYIKDDQ